MQDILESNRRRERGRGGFYQDHKPIPVPPGAYLRQTPDKTKTEINKKNTSTKQKEYYDFYLRKTLSKALKRAYKRFN